MKKLYLICFVILFTSNSFAQVKENYPAGFRKASVPASLTNKFIRKDYVRKKEQTSSTENVLFRNNPLPMALSSITDIIGATKYDLQTNNSVNNLLSYNNDVTISACWSFSPDANTSTTPPYPNLGTGYNYWTNNWQWTFPTLPITSISGMRTVSPNIVVTPQGREMTLQHNVIAASQSRITINWRPVKGTGSWTTGLNPWSATANYQYVKACGGLTNENVYAIWIDVDTMYNTGSLYFSRSNNGGQTWTPETMITVLDTSYDGFEPDSYSIDAKGDTVAISAGYELTDIVLLKSTDAGNNWTKTIVQKNPIPHFQSCNCSTNYIVDTNAIDTVRANGGDSKVLIDNNGMCHVWFSALDYHSDPSGIYIHYATDNLFYWNENMGADTTTTWDGLTGGHGTYVAIASSEDFNGNGIIDVPSDTFTTCINFLPWGYYDGGITQMPTVGIDENSNIYVAYQTIDELADTATWHMAHRHIYVVVIPYDMQTQTYDHTMISYPFNIIPSIFQGGDGENEECVFPSMARRVVFHPSDPEVLIIYQEDQVPGTSIFPAGSCQQIKNLNVQNAIRLWSMAIGINGVDNPSNELFISRNYPNPANGTTKVDLKLSKTNEVNIRILDISGREVNRESKGLLHSGSHTIVIDNSDLSAGIYTCIITAGQSRKTLKMVIQ